MLAIRSATLSVVASVIRMRRKIAICVSIHQLGCQGILLLRLYYKYGEDVVGSNASRLMDGKTCSLKMSMPHLIFNIDALRIQY